MISLEQLKNLLEQNKNAPLPLVFVYSDTPFIAEQYIRRMSKIYNKEIVYVSTPQDSIFGVVEDTLTVMFTDELHDIPVSVDIIVAKKVVGKIDHIEIPKIDPLWVKDYLFSCLDGVTKGELENFFVNSKGNIYRIDQEIQKLKNFSKKEKSSLFYKMIETGQFDDMTSKTVFDLTNAILKKDKNSLSELICKLKYIECDPVGVSAILYQNLKRYIQVWMSNNPTEENTGLKRNVIYAIRNQPKVFSKEQLLQAFQFVCGVDKGIKTGSLDTSWLVDYMICKIFTI